MKVELTSKKRVLCIGKVGLLSSLGQAEYEVVRLDSPALAINRMGLADFDLVIVGKCTASSDLLMLLTDFLRRQQQAFLTITDRTPLPLFPGRLPGEIKAPVSTGI